MADHRARGVRRIAIGVVTAFVLASAAAVPALAATGFDETILTSDVGEDSFGFAVAVDGDRVVVGAPTDDEMGSESGSVHVYDRDDSGTWVETELFAPDATERDRFGLSVAVQGDRVVVGAPRGGAGLDERGEVYVYEEDASGSWTVTTLTAFDGAVGDLYGTSVALDGDRVVVGAPSNDEKGDGAGAAYVYQPDGSGGWAAAKLTWYAAAPADAFGREVAAGDGLVVVGAPGADGRADSAGAAYVFDTDGLGTWSATPLTASGGAANDRYGSSVGVDGGRVVIGAPGNTGAAYVYAADGAQTWAETALTLPGGAVGRSFGSAVAVDGDRIVVGDYADASTLINMGAAYVYQPEAFGGWAGTKLTASDGAFFDEFGWAVAVDGDRVVVGAFAADDETDPWSAYVYDIAAAGTPPVITVPGGLSMPATSIAGAAVSFEASAVDDVDGPVPVDCVPASGSVFAPGFTTVACSATDQAGNEAGDTFEVFVEIPTDATGFTMLLQGISGLGLPKKETTSLAAPVKQAMKLLTDRKTGNDGAACAKLASFQAIVGARLTVGSLTAANADLLSNWAAGLADGNQCTV